MRSYQTAEVAAFCQVSPNTVGRWMAAGKLPYFMTAGGRRRVWGADVVRLLESLNIPVPSELGPGPNLKVVVVEDEESVRRLVIRWVKRRYPDAEVAEASDGFEAGRQVGLLKPELVILDIYLPGLDGMEVCRRLRADSGLAGTRILAVSGKDVKSTRQSALAAGADEFLPKPFELDELAAAVGRILPERAQAGGGSRGR